MVTDDIMTSPRSLLEQLLAESEIISLISSLVPGSKSVSLKSKNSSREVYIAVMDGSLRRNAVTNANKIIAANSDLEEVAVAPNRKTKTFAFKTNDSSTIYEIQTKPDGKRTAADPNELMTAAACFIPNLKSKIPTNTQEMDVFIEEIISIISSGKVKDFDTRQLNVLDSDYDNSTKAISAAIVIQQYIGSVPDVAYLTGRTWNSAIAKFKRDAYGMKDFNSSDIVFSKGKDFFGISLKKKDRVNIPDPTLINKSFASLFDSSNEVHKELLVKIEESKKLFYSSVIEDAMKDGIIEPFVFDKNKWQKYIGSVDNDYINKKLRTENSFFKDVHTVIDKEKVMLADHLIKLILKIDLKELKASDFNFALVTGIGRFLEKGPVIEKGEIVEISTVANKLDELFASGSIEMITTPGKKQSFEPEGSSAALYFTIKVGSLNILNIVLRYSGTFSAQPVFMANMTKEFKDYLTK